jgi:threonine dehydratase
MPSARDFARAAEVVNAHLRPTPVLMGEYRSRPLALKLESLQPTGSFKVRGGLASVAASLARDPQARLVAASAGNHGLGMAWAAQRLGASAVVVVPATASPAKLAALERFAIDVVRVDGGYDDAEAHALALARRSPTWSFVSPYNDADVIAGQATLGIELLSQVDKLACLVTPVGGGGLISGLAWACRPAGIPVYGVEAQASPVMQAAISSDGAPPRLTIEPTLADGLAGNLEPGSITIEMVRSDVAGLVAVSEEEIAEAMRYLATQCGLVVEGSGAVAMAAVMSDRIPIPGPGATGVIVTGRNIDLGRFARVLAD